MKIKRILYILMIIAIILAPISSVQATRAGDVINDGKSFIQKGTSNGDNINVFSKDALKDISNTLYNVLLVVGIVIAVLLGAIMGVKFIIEGAEGKAEVQKALVPYVIGCIVVFGAFAIWKIVVTILQNASL